MKIEKAINEKNITDRNNRKTREGNTNPTPKGPQPVVTIVKHYFAIGGQCQCVVVY